MQDIADRVGVNRITVSNVLNGRLNYQRSDAARRADEIRRVAHEMGFRVNAAAKATRTGKTGFIGVIRSPSLNFSVHSSCFEQGLDEELHARGLCMVRDMIDDASDPKNVSVPRIVNESAVDGLLINYAYGTPPAIRNILDRCHIPAIWINRKRESNCVHPNDMGAAEEATRHILSYGHKRIWFVNSPRSTYTQPVENAEPHYCFADRWNGYKKTMESAGLHPEKGVLIPSPPEDVLCGSGHALRAVIEMLRRPDRPSAILFSCELGRVALHAAAILNIRVPQDLSIITFDNDAGADNLVLVDRVLVPDRPMGRAAVSELCELMENPDATRNPVVIPFEFHVTGTVGKPRDSV